MVDATARSCQHLQRYGFSGVELSCGHGHLFHQFLSPWSNRREDSYGGDWAGRTRLIAETVQAIRAACRTGSGRGCRIWTSSGDCGHR